MRASSGSSRRIGAAAAAAVAVALLGPAGRAGAAGGSAEEVLSAAGVRAGLCVQLGCRDAALAAELAKGRRLLVHALTLDPEAVAKARQGLQEAGLNGQVTIEALAGGWLPHADNLVNLILAEDAAAVAKAGVTLAEIARALAPNGVALLGNVAVGEVKAALADARVEQAGSWVKVIKPRPAEMDEWPQRWHGADGNPVSHDTLVAAPADTRWVAGPEWPKGHRKASTLAVVSAGGRNFYYTVNAAPNLFLPPQQPGQTDRWFLLARDAYNGMLLWQQPWEVGSWWRGAYNYYHGPVPLAAEGERVFAGLKKNTLVTLDAATGKVLSECGLDSMPQDVACLGGAVIVRTEAELCGVDPAGGKLKWRQPVSTRAFVAADGGVFYLEERRRPGAVVRLDAADGKTKWTADTKDWGMEPVKDMRRQKLDIACHHGGMLFLVEDIGRLHAVSADDGKRVWSSPAGTKYAGPHFVTGGMVWGLRPDGEATDRRGQKIPAYAWDGLDITAGQVKKSVRVTRLSDGCGRPVATDRYLIYCKTIAFIDLEKGDSQPFYGIRGPCSLHNLPANGLLYSHPVGCGCDFVWRWAMRGFTGMAPAGPAEKPDAPADRLVKGPAFGQAPPAFTVAASDWPTYRHDARRSCRATSQLPGQLKRLWSVRLAEPPAGPLTDDWTLGRAYGEPLSAPVVAGGLVFLAAPDAHNLLAVDAADGKLRWTFTAGGRIDSPPTIDAGLCIFGCKDGWVYCLTAADGRLVWRSRAAPSPRRIVAFGQLESAWPVCGSVLVDNGVVYAAAGRGPKVDGGHALLALEAATGKTLWEKRLPQTDSTGQFILLSDGQEGYMGAVKFPLKAPAGGAGVKHPVLETGYGLLSNPWRRLPTSVHKGQNRLNYGGIAGFQVAFDDRAAYAYAEINNTRPKGKVGNWGFILPSHVFAATPAGIGQAGGGRAGPTLWAWPVPEPAQVEAMVVAGDALLAAGPADKYPAKTGKLWTISAADGARLTECDLESPPVYDGLAAAAGRLFLAARDGTLLCLGEK